RPRRKHHHRRLGAGPALAPQSPVPAIFRLPLTGSSLPRPRQSRLLHRAAGEGDNAKHGGWGGYAPESFDRAATVGKSGPPRSRSSNDRRPDRHSGSRDNGGSPVRSVLGPILQRDDGRLLEGVG